MILATPDFGAGSYSILLLAFVWLIVVISVLISFGRGANLLEKKDHQSRRLGVGLLLLSGLLPLCCWVGPSYLTRLEYGNFPIGDAGIQKISEGMTREQVEANLGTPHSKSDQGEGAGMWYYWIDSFGIRQLRVAFGDDGKAGNLRTD